MPGSTTITVSDEHLSTVAFNYMPEMRSVIDRERPIVEDAMTKGLEKQEGGERVIIPFQTNRSTVTKRVVTGYELADDTVNPIGTPGHDSWAFVMRPVMISRRDRLINRGKAKQVDLMKTRLMSAEKGMKAEFESVLLRGAAASNTWVGEPAWADWNTLNGTDDATGFIEEVDPSTNTLHNISKAAYSGSADFPGFHNPTAGASAAFSTGGLTAIDTVLYEIMERSGSIPPGLVGYIRTECARHLKRSYRAQEFYTKNDRDPGRPILVYNNVEHKLCNRLPIDGQETQTYPWSIVYVNWGEDIKVVGQTGAIFQLSPFATIPGSGVQIALQDFMGQNIACYLGRSGLVFDANAWS